MRGRAGIRGAGKGLHPPLGPSAADPELDIDAAFPERVSDLNRNLGSGRHRAANRRRGCSYPIGQKRGHDLCRELSPCRASKPLRRVAEWSVVGVVDAFAGEA